MEYKGYHVPSKEELEAMKNVDVKTVDRESLVDISTVHIRHDLPPEERMLDFIQQIKNPYCYRDGQFVVKLKFAGERTLEESLIHYLHAMES